MDKALEIKRLLLQIIGVDSLKNYPFNADLKSVSGEKCSIKVGDLEITDVRLKATINDAQNYLLLKPKVNTKVMVISLTGDLSDLCVIKCDEVEKVEYKQSDLEIIIDSVQKKVCIKNNTYSLKTAFDDIITGIKAITVPTGTGPSGTPVNFTMFDAVTTKLNQLLF